MATVKDLPFIEDDGFVLTGVNAMVNYIVESAERGEMLGKNINDKIKIDSFRTRDTLQCILSLICKVGEIRSQHKEEYKK
jgi:hypothetical protein